MKFTPEQEQFISTFENCAKDAITELNDALKDRFAASGYIVGLPSVGMFLQRLKLMEFPLPVPQNQIVSLPDPDIDIPELSGGISHLSGMLRGYLAKPFGDSGQEDFCKLAFSVLDKSATVRAWFAMTQAERFMLAAIRETRK